MKLTVLGALVSIPAIAWIANRPTHDDVEVVSLRDDVRLLRHADDNVVIATGGREPCSIAASASSISAQLADRMVELGVTTGGYLILSGPTETAPSFDRGTWRCAIIAQDESARSLAALEIQPDLRFRSRLEVHLHDGSATCHFKGAARTPGDIVVHLEEERVLWVGHLLTPARHPRFEDSDDVDLRAWIRILEQLAEDFRDEDPIVVPARGSHGSVASIREQAEYLQATLTYMERAQRHGESLDEALEFATTLRERFAQRDGDYDALLRLAYARAGR